VRAFHKFAVPGLHALLTTLGLALGVPARSQDATPTFNGVDSMEARVQGCVTCHGTHGQGTSNGYFPRIAGKPSGYLYNQLMAFRDGKRHYPPMNYLVAYLPDAYLKEIADYFADQRPPFAQREVPTVEPSVVTLGQALVTQGDAKRGIPACIACHGASLTGMNPGIPGLVGLRPAYIAAQLTRWKVGSRHAAEPDCMKRIASRLSEADIGAVSAWLARQELPPDPSPEKSNVNRMPFACGSQR
jgi:cytochrome c553